MHTLSKTLNFELCVLKYSGKTEDYYTYSQKQRLQQIAWLQFLNKISQIAKIA